MLVTTSRAAAAAVAVGTCTVSGPLFGSTPTSSTCGFTHSIIIIINVGQPFNVFSF